MSRQLHITVRFLAGRYHGEEWPPSPARLFQALVAGATAGCRVLDWSTACAALTWLEGLEPPDIVASEAPRGFAYKAFAPNNDSDAGNVIALVGGGIPLPDAMRHEAMLTQKVFRPRLLTDADEAVVHYLWRLPEGDAPGGEAYARQMCVLARNLLALGWGIDVAVGDGQIVSSHDALPTGRNFIPAWDSAASISLKCPAPGFLADIERAYKAFRRRMTGQAVDTDTRPRGYRSVPYRVVGDVPNRLFITFELRDKKGGWQAFRWQDGMLVAAWLRHATSQRFQIEGWDTARIDTYISGHQEKGQEPQRLSYVPLPSIGHEYADGRHRRVLVVLPFGDNGEARSVLNRMAGDELVSLKGESMAWLARGQSDGVLGRYIAESVEWLSVTPVILHGLDCDGGRFRPRKAEKLILQAFGESGYDIGAIEEFSYQPAPFWRGAGAARQAQVPKHLGRWPRYHVRVVFKNAVRGPVLVGIGRHYGLGIFATPTLPVANSIKKLGDKKSSKRVTSGAD